jgi:hypothetical protein
MNSDYASVYTHYSPQSADRSQFPNWLQYGLLLCMAWLSLFTMSNLVLSLHHIPTVVAICVALFIILSDKGSLTRSQVVVGLVGLPLMISTIASGDREGALFCWSYPATIIAFIAIGARRSVRPQTFIWYFFVVVLPEFILSKYWFGPIVKNDSAFISEADTSGYVPTVLPLPENGWHLHIGPWGETYHYSASVGLVLGAVCLVRYLRTRRTFYVWLLSFSVYLVVFSGTRTSYLGLAIMAVLFLLNRTRRRVVSSWLTIIAFLFILYGADVARSFIPRVDSEAVNSLLRQNMSDVTSGRQWLWSYHFNKLREYPLTGIGLSNTRFRIGTVIEGERTRASNESFYTQILAAFGYFGFCLTAIHIYLITMILRNGNLLRIMLAGLIVVGTAGASWFGVIYVPVTFFVLAYVCCGLDSHQEGGSVPQY